MRHFIYVLFISCSLLSCASNNQPDGEASPPNIILFLADDQGWGDLSSSGNVNLSTPHIDRLAEQGASFSRFYVSPVCSPTRAEILTGRHHARSGVYSTSAGGERIDLDEKTIAEALKSGGYVTGAFGKWHNGMQAPYHPNARGFDEFYGFASGHWGNYFSPKLLEHNGELVQGEGFVIDDFTSKAIEFIENNQDQPFFVYLPYNTPHSPMQVPDEWFEKFDGNDLALRGINPHREDVQKTRAALAMVENIDWNVGRVMETLSALSLEENTIVMYMTDNGPNGNRWNGGMKGNKGSTNEGGVRSPFYMQWINRIQPGTEIEHIAANIDLFPTLIDFAGIEYTSNKPFDGVSLRPLLEPGDEDWPDRIIYSHWNDRVSLRTQQYRLDNENNLYDMVADPGQLENVASTLPDVASELITAKEEWESTVLAELTREKRLISVGHPDFPFTQLPARDAIPSGAIERSNRYPNDSFFSNWTSTKEEIVWDVDVLADGEFEVVIYYTCAEGQEGSLIELTMNDHSVQGQITQAHDSPLMGDENDRIPRIESYIKDFIPMSLGTISLSKGTGILKLKAIDIPGDMVMDFRLMMLERKE